MENKKMKIGAVVVTYNRLDKLKKALESFEKQLYLPAYVIVADNASTDGTAQYLRQWQKEDAGFEKIILTMESNMGGSGGFYVGIKRAISNLRKSYQKRENGYQSRKILLQKRDPYL